MGEHGNIWDSADLEVTVQGTILDYKIVFEAIVGTPGKADIGLDDVVFHENCM